MSASFEDHNSERDELDPEAALAALAAKLSDGHGNINRPSPGLAGEVVATNNGLLARVLRAAGVKSPPAKLSTAPVTADLARNVGLHTAAATLDRFEGQPGSDQVSRVELTVFKAETPHEGHRGAHTRAGITLIMDEYRLRLTQYRPGTVAGHDEVVDFVEFSFDGSLRSHSFTDRARMSDTGSAIEAAISGATVMTAQLGFDIPNLPTN